jgi:Lon protease-like protein
MQMPSIKELRRRISTRWFKKRPKRKAADSEAVGQDCSCSFPLLDLSDDLISHILSFVSSAPFEEFADDESLYTDFITPTMNKNRKPTHFSPFQPASHYQAALSRSMEIARLTKCAFGTLTHVLPLVCWRFHKICRQSDGLWQEAIHRLSISSPEVWQLGISKLTKDEDNQKSVALEMVAIGEQSTAPSGEGKLTFQRVVEQYQPFTLTAPVFIMGGHHPPTLTETWDLHLFEPRYRFMMAQLMLNRPIREKSGTLIGSPRPRFLVSSGLSYPLMVGDPVFIVELLQCQLMKDGRALVRIVPVQQTRIRVLVAKPMFTRNHRLFYATVEKRKRTFQDMRLPVISAFTATELLNNLTLFSSVEVLFWQEPHRRAIRELMADWEVSTTGDRPLMILSTSSGMEANGVDATVIEVRKCSFNSNGSSNVEIIPLARGRLRDIVERPNGDRQYDASIDIIK